MVERYARALFLTLQEKSSSSLKIAQKQFLQITEMILKDEKVRTILQSPFVPMDQKKVFLKKNIQSTVEGCLPTVLNFIDCVVSKKRIHLLSFIFSKFEQIMDESIGAVKVFVQSASSLDEKTKETMKKELCRIFKKNVLIETSIHPELLAGVTVQVGDVVIDNSLKSQLRNMREYLKG